MPIYILVDGVKGSVTETKHPDWIEVESWSWGVSHPHDYSGGSGQYGGGTSKTSVQDVHITKQMDISSTKLLDLSLTGNAVKSVKLESVQSGASKHVELLFEMSDVIFTSFQTGDSSGSARPVESLSMNFSKITFRHIPLDTAGKPMSPLNAGYDVKLSKAL
jgi:type VI secretion system secreted protein Hcp